MLLALFVRASYFSFSKGLQREAESRIARHRQECSRCGFGLNEGEGEAGGADRDCEVVLSVGGVADIVHTAHTVRVQVSVVQQEVSPKLGYKTGYNH